MSGPTRTLIGLDLGARHARVAQLERAPRGTGGWRARALAVLPRPAGAAEAAPTADEARSLRGALERQGFVGRQVVLAVPHRGLRAGIIELPPVPTVAARDAVARAELARMHKCDPAGFEMAYWELPAPPRASRLGTFMAVACPHAEADALIAPFDAAGLDVVALDVRACAAARALGAAVPAGARAAAALDLGHSAARLLVFTRGAVVYDRVMGDAALGALHKGLCKQFALDPEVCDYLLGEVDVSGDGSAPAGADPGAGHGAEAVAAVHADAARTVAAHLAPLARELATSLAYVARQYPELLVDRLLLTGAGAGIRGLDALLGRGLGLAVQCVTVGELVVVPPALVAHAGAVNFATAVGLTLHADAGEEVAACAA